MAITQEEKWAHQYILYVTDNMVVKEWLRTRRPKHRHGRVLCRILARLEARHKFVTTSAYVRTYHTITNDWLTRETEDVIQRGMRQAGYCELDPSIGWGAALEAARLRQWLLPADNESTKATFHQVRNRELPQLRVPPPRGPRRRGP